MLEKLQAALNYTFKDVDLLELALTTPSSKDSHEPINNQRLEFLGDAILGCVTSDILFRLYPKASEGKLTAMRLHLVSTESLVQRGEKFQLHAMLQDCKKNPCNVNKDSNAVADCIEAIIGAAWIDGGLEAARKVVSAFIADEDFNNVGEISNFSKNPKGLLQYYVQKKSPGNTPLYEISSRSGPSHKPYFICQVTALNQTAQGGGSSKQKAETEAAQALLQVLNKGSKNEK